MKYRTLGRTGLQVSEIGYGGEHITDADYETSRAVLHRAVDAGINIMDVFMPQPEVRDHMGRALKDFRKEVFLQGHIGSVLENGQCQRSRAPALCEQYLQDFFTRLRTDYIDLGMMFFIDSDEDFDASFGTAYTEYVLGLKKRGIIRYIGASSHNPLTAVKIVETGLVDMLMFSVNPAFDLLPAMDIDALFAGDTYKTQRFALDPARTALYRLCQEKGVGITTMKTLGGGMLLNKDASPFGAALTPAQCIHYALERPAVASVMMGARSVEELDACLLYETATEAEKDYTFLANTPYSSIQGSCMYCNHCLPCPSSIDIAAVTKYLDIAKQNGGAPDTIREHYKALSAHGGDCIGCGSCEAKCPFQVQVQENMANAREVFGL